MMFKGTEKRSAADVNRELDELGGQGNAYTTEEQTVYYATVLPKFQDKLVDLLTDMLSPALSNEEFGVERKVILEEIAKYEDQPPFGAFERSMEVHYGPRGLGRRVLGTAESIRAMTASKMREYFSAMYRPDNMVLAATGNIDFDGLVSQVEKLITSWNSRSDVASEVFSRMIRRPFLTESRWIPISIYRIYTNPILSRLVMGPLNHRLIGTHQGCSPPSLATRVEAECSGI